jgi:hypothetical protein
MVELLDGMNPQATRPRAKRHSEQQAGNSMRARAEGGPSQRKESNETMTALVDLSTRIIRVLREIG